MQGLRTKPLSDPDSHKCDPSAVKAYAIARSNFFAAKRTFIDATATVRIPLVPFESAGMLTLSELAFRGRMGFRIGFGRRERGQRLGGVRVSWSAFRVPNSC